MPLKQLRFEGPPRDVCVVKVAASGSGASHRASTRTAKVTDHESWFRGQAKMASPIKPLPTHAPPARDRCESFRGGVVRVHNAH